MRTKVMTALAATISVCALTVGLQAQQPPPQFPNMTFFVTSIGGPAGANLGGLDGADKHCQTLATKAGAGTKTWHAYLSTQAIDGATAVNARDRIGKGRGSTPRACRSRPASMTCIRPTTRSVRSPWWPRTAGWSPAGSTP